MYAIKNVYIKYIKNNITHKYASNLKCLENNRFSHSFPALINIVLKYGCILCFVSGVWNKFRKCFMFVKDMKVVS